MYPKDFIELNILPYVYMLRKIFVLFEAVSLVAYYMFHLKNLNINIYRTDILIQIGIMVLTLIFLNILNLKIYEVMILGWLDMQFKW